MALAEREPPVGVASVGLVDQHQGAALGERAEDVPHGEVEVQGGDGQDPVRRPESVPLVDVLDGVHRGTVADLDALGRAGGTGGEDDVGALVGGHVHGGVQRRRPEGLVEGQEGGRGPRPRRRPRAVQDEHAAAQRVDAVAAFGGLVDADGDVGAARGQDAEHRRDLVGSLGRGDDDRAARPDAPGGERTGHPQRAVRQFPVGETAVLPPQQCRVPGPAGRPLEERPVQRTTALPPGHGVRLGTTSHLGLGQGYLRRETPVGGRQAPHQGGVRREHGVRHALREELLDDVPRQQQTAFAGAVHLVVEPDLGRLGDHPGQLAEAGGEVVGHERGVEVAGEDDGCRARGPGVDADEVAQHVDARVRGVADVVVQAPLDRAGPVGEACLRGQVDLEEQQAGEVGHDALDVGMEVLVAVEQGEVEQKPGLSAPPREDLGEGSDQ